MMSFANTIQRGGTMRVPPPPPAGDDVRREASKTLRISPCSYLAATSHTVFERLSLRLRLTMDLTEGIGGSIEAFT